MIKKTLSQAYGPRGVAIAALLIAIVGSVWYVHHTDQRAITAATSATAAATAATSATKHAALAAAASAMSARRAADANCDAIKTVSDTVNPIHADLKRLVDSALVDKTQTIERINTNVRIATTPAQRRAAIVARRQTEQTLRTFERISKDAKAIPVLKCSDDGKKG